MAQKQDVTWASHLSISIEIEHKKRRGVLISRWIDSDRWFYFHKENGFAIFLCSRKEKWEHDVRLKMAKR